MCCHHEQQQALGIVLLLLIMGSDGRVQEFLKFEHETASISSGGALKIQKFKKQSLKIIDDDSLIIIQ